MALHLSVKHIQISKANNQLALVIAAAVVISVFSLVSAKALLSQASYQRRVLSAKHTAANQLKANVNAAKQLLTQYEVFEGQNPNIIGGVGGSNPGNGPSDGDNARIVLDALPSQYDFPALISSLEKILAGTGVNVQAIGGTDEGQPAAAVDAANIQPLPMTFSVDALGTYDNAKKVALDFERSIRPIDVNSLQLSGTQNILHITVNATTYYQPSKTLTPSQKEIR